MVTDAMLTGTLPVVTCTEGRKHLVLLHHTHAAEKTISDLCVGGGQLLSGTTESIWK